MGTLRKRRTANDAEPPKKALTRAKPGTGNNSDFTDLTDRIKEVTSLGVIIAALFYGRAGTGKTTLGASFPKPLLHLDIREKGTDSIADLDQVNTVSVEDWDDFEKIYWFLKAGGHGYKTVVIDAVSQLQDFAVEKAQQDDGKQFELVTKRQWGAASGYLKTWIINYRDLVDEGINVVFLAHDRVHEGEEGEEGELTPTVGPRLMPSVASILTASVKLIGNTLIRETYEKLEGGKQRRIVSYCLRVGPHAYYETKIRQPKGSYTPDFLENPTYEKLVALMKGELKPEKEPAKKEPNPSQRKLLKRK